MPADQYQWYAIYVNPRAEKKTNTLLTQKGLHSYLPLQRRIKQWSDRKKLVEEPLFTSYVFVFITPKQYLSVLETPGVVRFITFSGKAAVIREEQINVLKMVLSSEAELELSQHVFEKGEYVKIKAGPFLGLQGELISTEHSKRFLVRFEQLNSSLLVNISPVYLEPVF